MIHIREKLGEEQTIKERLCLKTPTFHKWDWDKVSFWLHPPTYFPLLKIRAMFASSAACLTFLLLSFYSNLICLKTPKRPPSHQAFNSLTSVNFFFFVCAAHFWSTGSGCQPGCVWGFFLLLLCSGWYVLLLFELKCCSVCLLTTCSCKVSHVLHCELSNTSPPFMCAWLCCFLSARWCTALTAAPQIQKSRSAKAPSMRSSCHLQWHILTDYSTCLWRPMCLYHYWSNRGANSTWWCNTEI